MQWGVGGEGLFRRKRRGEGLWRADWPGAYLVFPLPALLQVHGWPSDQLGCPIPILAGKRATEVGVGRRLYLGELREAYQPSPEQRPPSTVFRALTRDQGGGRHLSSLGRAEGSQCCRHLPHRPPGPGPTLHTPKTTPGEEQGRAASWRQLRVFI